VLDDPEENLSYQVGLFLQDDIIANVIGEGCPLSNRFVLSSLKKRR